VRTHRTLKFGQYNGAMTFRVVLEYDPEAQAYSAVCPELPGCASAGDSVEEAKQNIREAIALYLSPSEVALSCDARLDEVTVG
jgi:predicted RNase H-like HicB family nuclease